MRTSSTLAQASTSRRPTHRVLVLYYISAWNIHTHTSCLSTRFSSQQGCWLSSWGFRVNPPAPHTYIIYVHCKISFFSLFSRSSLIFEISSKYKKSSLICKILDNFYFSHFLIWWLFLPGDFLHPSEEAFFGCKILIFGILSKQKNLSPNLQNFWQLLAMSFFDPTTFFSVIFWYFPKRG